MGPLPDKGTPAYVKMTPLHLTTSYSFLVVSRTKSDSALAGLSTEGDDLDDLAQEPAAEADDGSRRICARGARFLLSELVGALYELGARPTIAEVAPQLFVSILTLTKDTPAYENVLDWVQASFTKLVWRNYPSLSFREGPIRTSRSWGASDFEANLQDGRQAAEFIRGRFPSRYGAPLAPVDTTSARVTPMAKASIHAARDGVEAQTLWGDDLRAHLGDAGADNGARVPPVFTPFGRVAVGAFVTGSGSGWGGSLATERTNRGSRAWGSAPLGAAVGSERTTVGGGGGGQHQRRRCAKRRRRTFPV